MTIIDPAGLAAFIAIMIFFAFVIALITSARVRKCTTAIILAIYHGATASHNKAKAGIAAGGGIVQGVLKATRDRAGRLTDVLRKGRAATGT